MKKVLEYLLGLGIGLIVLALFLKYMGGGYIVLAFVMLPLLIVRALQQFAKSFEPHINRLKQVLGKEEYEKRYGGCGLNFTYTNASAPSLSSEEKRQLEELEYKGEDVRC